MGNNCNVPPLEGEEMDYAINGNGEQKFDFVPKEHYIDDIRDIFQIGRTLGSGVSCKVYVGKNKEDQKKYAVKEMLRKDEFNPRSFRQEVEFLTTLAPHDNVLKYKTAYISPEYFYIITELCTGGALFDRVRKLKHFSEKQAAEFLKVLIKSIQHCHSRNIVHRDLKPENVVFDGPTDDANLVIIDFGDAAIVDDHEIYSEFVGTIFYLPPEITRHRHGWELKKSDMWTIGVIAYVLVSGKPPFFGRDNKAILQKIMLGKYAWPSGVKLSKPCKAFIRSLLQLDCHKRSSPAQALKHPFLTGRASEDNLGETYLQNLGDFYSGNILKKMLVNNMIVDMSKEDKKILIRAFREIDEDHSGFIEKDEIQAHLMKIGKSKTEAENQANEMMKVMDPKNTGKISLQDFVRAKTVAKLQIDDDALKKQYLSLSGGDEVISSKSFKSWIKQNNNELSTKQLDEIMGNVDEDGDGFVDYDEFQRAMMSAENLVSD